MHHSHHPSDRHALIAASAAGLVALLLVFGLVALSSGGESSSSEPSNGDLPGARKPVFFEPGPEEVVGKARDRTLDEIVAMGIDRVRLDLFWNNVLPVAEPASFDGADTTDPAYDFSGYDSFMRAAASRGLEILVTVSGPGPDWATEGGSFDTAPKVDMFGDFAQAVAERYSGSFTPEGETSPLPSAYLWSVFNEPNISSFLRPQYRDGQPYSPTLYRHLYLAGQAGIEKSIPDAGILIGDLAPTGSTDSVDPLPFIKGVLCMTPASEKDPSCTDGSTIDAVGVAIHPYQGIGKAPFDPPKKPSYVMLSRIQPLIDVLDDAADDGQIATGIPLYITEYGIQSYPDIIAGVPLETQADYISLSEYLAYSFPRIATFAQYLMVDDPPDHVPGVIFGGFESGLKIYTGKLKPSFHAFPVPLVVRREGNTVHIWGLVRPARGETTAELWVQDGGVAKKLESVDTNETGILQVDSPYEQGRLWQLRWTEPGGQQLVGPWTRSYAFELPPGADESALAG